MKLLLRTISIGRWSLPLPVFAWFLLAMLAAVAEISRGPAAINNYHIYTGVFEHAIKKLNLYVSYPGEYIDTNHYGPFFSIVIAPFAILPDYLGCFLWCFANTWILFYAIQQLSFSKQQRNIILLIGLVEMMTAIHNVQFNVMLTGWMILSFALVEKEKDFGAAFFIIAGLFVKIYGVVGIAFFCFSKHRLRFVASLIFWFVVLFCLPMALSSPSFVIQSYQDWANSLVEKNAQNIDSSDENLMQDISVMGMIRRIFGKSDLPNYFITIPAALIYALPLLRVKQYTSLQFRAYYLCLAMIGVVIFSSSAESSTFVIAVVPVGIWYILQDPSKKVTNNLLLIFVILLTSLSATDLFPRYLREHFILPYSLKALPCFIIWLILAFRLIMKTFTTSKNIQ